MVRIDGFENLAKKEVLDLVVSTIKTCMRAFDDAYYLNEGHFLLSLKQTDVIGAEAATDRLEIIIAENRKTEDVTLSYCISEPIEGDEVLDLLDSMKKDLERHSDEKNVCLKFFETTPLQQYIENLNG